MTHRNGQPALAPLRCLLAGIACALAGCAGSVRPAQESFRQGQVEQALATLQRERPRLESGNDAVLFWLEYGSLLHHSGDFARSTDAFLRAEQRMEELDASPETSLSEQAAALLTNPNAIAYRGTTYDRVMSPIYRGLNALLEGDIESPRQAFNEAALRLADAIEARRETIDRLTSETERPNAGEQRSLALRRTLADPTVRSRLDSTYDDLRQYEPYTNYANPFAELLHALYLLAVQQDHADADRARTMLRRVAGMAPDNPFVLDDLDAAERATAGQRLAGITYVIFATGTAPTRRGERIDLPLFFFNDTVDYFGITLPLLVFNPTYERVLWIEAAGTRIRTAVVADMDRIVAADFQFELPLLVQRSILSASVKAAGAYAVNRSVRDDSGWAGLAVRIGLIAYQYAQNTTDLRSWTTLPKQFQYARLPTPSDGRLLLQRESGETISLELDPDRINIIIVRSIAPRTGLLFRTVVLPTG